MSKTGTKIESLVNKRLVSLATKKLRDKVEAFLNDAQEYVETTKNPWDNLIVDYIKEITGIDAVINDEKAAENRLKEEGENGEE